MDKRNNTVVLSLGGNVGDVKKTFLSSIDLLGERVGEVVLTSSLYQTKAWGVANQPDFLNQILILKTSLQPIVILKHCMEIEKELGRIRAQKWFERTIDIDVLFYDSEVIKTPDLIVPHPFIQERNFVLIPLGEILPNFVHPLLNTSIEELKKSCKDELEVIKCLP